MGIGRFAYTALLPATQRALGAGTVAPLAWLVRAPRRGLGRLSAAYFLEGLGYIVSGTFAVAAVRRTPGLEVLAPWIWILTGLAAAPSALLWSAVGRRVGLRRALAPAMPGRVVGTLQAGILAR